ncbi:MAG: DUF4340 domain-containing protein [Pseudomarimonas sp.]
MSARQSGVIGLLAVLAVALAMWAMNSRAPQRDVGLQGPLLADLKANLNDVREVKIVGAANATLATIERAEDGWKLRERNGYPVDAGKLRGLLIALADARRVEAKTSNPAMHDRLAVEDVSGEKAQGVAVEIARADKIVRVIVGENNARGKGTYVRLDGEATSWLVDTNIAVERRPVEWLQRELINIPTARIASVEVTPAVGETIQITREKGLAGDFRVQNMPRGREQQSEFVADATAGLLDSLQFDDVAAADTQPQPAEGVRVARFRSNEGLTVSLHSWQANGKTYGRFEVGLDSEAATAWAAVPQAEPVTSPDAAEAAATAAAEGEASADASTSSAPAESSESRLATLRTELDTLKKRFADRVFELPAFKASSLNRSLEDYLKPKA